eukprot:Skav219165  [mRNA]  locus=scaffold648:263034:263732:- [translate_table: standard]
MPWLRLSRGPLEHVLHVLPDASVLRLAATCCSMKSAVEECRAMHHDGPWRHPPGPWEASGLWRLLGLGDLKMIPMVTLCCEAEFQSVVEVLGFLKAAKDLAADTIDGQVVFNNFSFHAAHLLWGDHDFTCERAAERVDFVFKGCQIECSLEVSYFAGADEVPWIYPYVQHQRLPENPFICCNSLLSPQMRLRASLGNIYFNDLDAGSPLTTLVRASMQLPMFLGVGAIDPEA